MASFGEQTQYGNGNLVCESETNPPITVLLHSSSPDLISPGGLSLRVMKKGYKNKTGKNIKTEQKCTWNAFCWYWKNSILSLFLGMVRSNAASET